MTEQQTDLMDITPTILLSAYSCGLFPMSESADDPDIFWVDPYMRGIIPLDQFHMPKSLKKTIRRGLFEIRINTEFREVMRACAEATPDRPSTWINEMILDLYSELHVRGHAHSVEAWQNNHLVGGLYGVSLGAGFFGESMFSRATDASKVCLAYLVTHLNERGFKLLDTQFTTDHLKRFGAIDVPRDEYQTLLADAMAVPDINFVSC